MSSLKTMGAAVVFGVAVCVLFISALESMAQLGMNEAACRSRFGQPVTVEGTTNGMRTLSFVTSNAFAEVWFVDGVLYRVVYRSRSGDTGEVARVLADCAGGARWESWRPAGRGKTDPGVRKWVRSDDAAFAELDGKVLTVTAEGWRKVPVVDPATDTVPVSTAGEETASAPAINTVVAELRPVPSGPPVAVKVPVVKPDPPARLPTKGATRDMAIQLLGQHEGRMVMKGVEILVYPWGCVWIKDGKVLTVE